MTKRRFQRVDRQILANYDHFNLDNLKDDEGMARTLDMSVRGLLLETPRSLEAGSTLRLGLNINEQVIEVFGQVARCSKNPDGTFEIGVELKYVPESYIEAVESEFTQP